MFRDEMTQYEPGALEGMEARVWKRIGTVKTRRKRIRNGLASMALLGVLGLGWFSWMRPGAQDLAWEADAGISVVEEISAQAPAEEAAWSLPAEEVIVAGVF